MGRVFFNTRKNVHALTVAYTVLDSDSGKIFTLDAAAGAYEVTLPTAPVEGFNCKFIVKEDTPTAAITIAAGSAILDGVQKDAGGDAANSTASTAVSNLIIGTSAAQGEVINLMSDGVTYYFECFAGINNSITTS
mgnify:FL=1